MGRKTRRGFDFCEVVKSLKKALNENPLLPFLLPVLLVLWFVEKFFFSLSNWVALVLAVWVTIQHENYRRRNLEEDLKKKWLQLSLQTSSITPLEQCEWLNKLIIDVWANTIHPRLSSRFSAIIERRLRHRKSRLIEKLELHEFFLGSSPPLLGLLGIRWTSSGDQRIMRLGFDWNTTDVNVLLHAKLAKPLKGTARIVINSIHIKGDLLLMPVLDGKAFAISFVSMPEVRIGIAFGSGGGQSLPGTELPGVSSWLVKIVMDALNKRMVEPRRQCLAFPAVDFQKKAVGGVLSVMVVSASKLRADLKGSLSTKQSSGSVDLASDDRNSKELHTFIEIELEEITRKTDVRVGANPSWDSTFNLILHDNAGIIRFNLYECTPGSVKYDHLSSCEVKMRYVQDDSTIFWAIGSDSSVIAKHADVCGKEIEMIVPFEGGNFGELTVKLILKEWHFADGSHSSSSLNSRSHRPLNGVLNYVPKTGRKINITIVDGKDLAVKDRTGKSGPYIKLHYGKVTRRTKTVSHSSNPIWNQKFEFDEIGNGEYLRIKCYTEETFSDESIGGARVSLEGLVDGSTREVCIPLEKVNSGELQLQIEAVKVASDGNSKDSHSNSGNGMIELVLIEARDLIAADLRGTSDPYVNIHYGKLKRRTKVTFKTLNPKWHQIFEFPDTGSPLQLHVRDYNAVLPTSGIGECVVEYQMLAPNEMTEKWIPLQGVRRGEIHVQITRKMPQLEKKSSSDSESTKPHEKISVQMKQMLIKIQSLMEDNDLEGLAKSINELESLQDTQEHYMAQLETEQKLLIDKVNDLGQEIFNSSPGESLRSTTFP